MVRSVEWLDMARVLASGGAVAALVHQIGQVALECQRGKYRVAEVRATYEGEVAKIRAASEAKIAEMCVAYELEQERARRPRRQLESAPLPPSRRQPSAPA